MKKIRTKAIFKKIDGVKTWYHKEDKILIVKAGGASVILPARKRDYVDVIDYIEFETDVRGVKLLSNLIFDYYYA